MLHMMLQSFLTYFINGCIKDNFLDFVHQQINFSCALQLSCSEIMIIIRTYLKASGRGNQWIASFWPQIIKSVQQMFSSSFIGWLQEYCVLIGQESLHFVTGCAETSQNEMKRRVMLIFVSWVKLPPTMNIESLRSWDYPKSGTKLL